MASSRIDHSSLSRPSILVSLALLGLMGLWLYEVNSNVPGPYLDEVFHVRQAIAYWEHRWRQWDPKITTPPGLYLTSYLAGMLLHAVLRYPSRPSAADMRYTNGVLLFNLLPFTLRKILKNLWRCDIPGQSTQESSSSDRKTRGWQLHLTVLNICMFPPIFFFSGLYYTDLAALLIVLYTYAQDLQRYSNPTQSHPGEPRKFFPRRVIRLVVLGLTSLSFRQTNIFWVAVFLGGLRVIRTLNHLGTECRATRMSTIAQRSWELCQVYDPPVSKAYFEGKFRILRKRMTIIYTL